MSEEAQKTVHIVIDSDFYEEAMSRSGATYWKRACAKKLKEFVRQNLFSIVSRPTGHKVVGCKWVFKIQLDKNEQIEYYKVRLVAQGFLQIPRVDFNEIFALVIHYQILWTFLGLANHYCWHIHQIDIKSACLNENLENEIFIKIPPGVKAEEEWVWLLYKALYGLKQASRE